MAKTTKTSKSAAQGRKRGSPPAEGEWDGNSKVFIKRLLRSDQIGDAGIAFLAGGAPGETGLGVTSAEASATARAAEPASVESGVPPAMAEPTVAVAGIETAAVAAHAPEAGTVEMTAPHPEEVAPRAVPKDIAPPKASAATKKPAKVAPKHVTPAAKGKAKTPVVAKRATPAAAPKKRPASSGGKRAHPQVAGVAAVPEMATLLREPVAGVEPTPSDWQFPPAPTVTPSVPPAVHYVPRQPPGRARRALRSTVLGAALLLAGIVGGGLLAVSWAPFGDTVKLVTDTFNWVADMLHRSPAVRHAEPAASVPPTVAPAPAPRTGLDAASPPTRPRTEPSAVPVNGAPPTVDRAAEVPATRPQFEMMLSSPSGASAAPPPPASIPPPAQAAPKFAPIAPAAAPTPSPAPTTSVDAPAAAAQSQAPQQPQAQPPAPQPLYPWGTVPYYGRPPGY
jgi:hypothetical protein